MIARMDKDIGRIMAQLEQLSLDENTLVIFASDNGPMYAGGVDTAFFQSAGPLRGLKGSVWEGGIRVPLIARWPGKIQPASVSEHVCAFWDFLPTCAELLDKQPTAGIGPVMGRCADNLRQNFCAGGVTRAGAPSTIPA